MISPQARWRVARPTPWPEPWRAEEVLEPGVDALPVQILVLQDRYVTGWDEGALGFEADALWFSGRATSFHLGAGRLSELRLPDAFNVVPHCRVALPHPTREVGLEIAVLDFEGRQDWQDEERLIKELRRLSESRGGAEGDQYPPLSVRPGATPVQRVEWDLFRRRSTFGGWVFALGRSRTFPLPDHGRERLLRAIHEETR